MNEVVLSTIKTEYQSLIEEIENIKLVIAALSAEKDDLELHVCREIQAEYDMKIGCLEYEIMNCNIEIERLKLVIDYMQSAINCTEHITEKEINKRAEEILGDYLDELKKKAESMKKDQEYTENRAKNEKSWSDGDPESNDENGDRVNLFGNGDEKDESEEDEKEESDDALDKEPPGEELKRLYRQIVKKLHPDINPNATEEEKRLLDEAIKAYADGDLERIREISEMLDEGGYGERFEDTEEGIAGLKRLLERLREQKEKLEAGIRDIMNSFPYNVRDFLEDEDAVRAKQDELKKKIESCKRILVKLEQKVELLSKELKKAAYGG